MSTTDRINTELTALQQELRHLKRYTDDLGKARDASSKVLQASDRFVTVFQTHVNGLVGAMEKGAADFGQTCAESSERLTNAADRFDTDIDRSHKLLNVLGKQLDATAVRVEQMTGEIRLMDLPGKFTQVREDLRILDSKLVAASAEAKQRHEQLLATYALQGKASHMRFSIGLGVALVNLALIAYLILR